jgi:NADH-quinone oxidoreductase subunit L
MGGEQDMRKMGGLKKALPITFATMLMGTIAISGIPPFSGFFSKDEILAHAYEHSPMLWFFGMVTSMLTAFYMFRLFFLTFYGKFRGTHDQEHHLHESPKTMTFPLIVLALCSVFAGVIGLPEFWHQTNWIGEYLSPIIAHKNPSTLPHDTEWMLMGIASVSAAVIIYVAYVIYMKRNIRPLPEGAAMPGLQKLIYNKYFVDELYEKIIRKPLDTLSAVYHYIDTKVIDEIVNGVGSTVNGLSSVVRKAQTGHIGVYIFSMVIGIVAILFYTFIK